MAKRESAKVGEVIDVVPAVSEDEALTTTDGRMIVGWVQALRQFFSTAEALETRAQSTLETAKRWTLPTTEAEDVQLQRAIKRTTEDKKEIEAHWEITAVISRFHRRLTAKRAIGVGALEQANTIGNRLHNQYTEAEKRRAAREEQERREAAELLAKQERDQELARLEAEAVAAEEGSPELSEREARFVEMFTAPAGSTSGSGQASAKVAGYKDPLAAAARLLSSAKIQMAIKAKQQAATIRRQSAAVAAAPVAVESVAVRPKIGRAPGASDRTTWGGEILNEAATIEAFRAGTHGIPADLFQINPAKLNEYGRSLHERLDLWPGVRHTKKTGVL